MAPDRLIVTGGRPNKRFEISLTDPIQRNYELVRELSLSAEPAEDVCRKYGCSRALGYTLLRRWQAERWDGLLPRRRGPRSRPKRDAVRKFVVGLRRARPESSMYTIAEALRARGVAVSARTVARVLREEKLAGGGK